MHFPLHRGKRYIFGVAGLRVRPYIHRWFLFIKEGEMKEHLIQIHLFLLFFSLITFLSQNHGKIAKDYFAHLRLGKFLIEPVFFY
jgi:hypothetical protein